MRELHVGEFILQKHPVITNQIIHAKVATKFMMWQANGQSWHLTTIHHHHPPPMTATTRHYHHKVFQGDSTTPPHPV